MAKKKKWWEQATSYKTLAQQFPNSAKQHAQTYPAHEYLVDDGYDADVYYNDGYDDWGRNLGKKETQKLTDNKTEYNTNYDSYQKTGHWGGYNYYKVPQLTYKYVQQMANALAGQHNIKLVVGNTWEVNLIKNQLTYNPSSLIYGTKSELLATLLHEIGKLRFMTHYTKLHNPYLAMYKECAAEALFPFEDVRVDFQMLKAYASAAELYESALPGVQAQVDMYKKYDKGYKEAFVQTIARKYKDIVDRQISDPDEYKIKLMQTFGTQDIGKVQERINAMVHKMQTNGSLFAYCADMLHVMYDLETPVTGFKNIQEKVELTQDAIEPIKREITSQVTADIMQTMVYPHIEDLLKDLQDNKKQIQDMFPEMSKSEARDLADEIKNRFENNVGKRADKGSNVPVPNAKKDGSDSRRGGSGPSDNQTPPEWSNGEYKPLKDSVDQEIKSLVHKLIFIRREEMTIKYDANQKRGKLNSRKLVKHAFGSRRLFKQKLPGVDTVQSFAFSVVIDISGSMQGPRMVHTTRAVVIFNEVFKKMNIPFELIVFGNTAKTIKKFDDNVDKTMEKRIAGLTQADGGGTNLDRGLNAVTIQKRSENNKIVIVLTDGGVGRAENFDSEFFIPWREKHNIKSMAFGLEIDSYEQEEVAKMCENTGKVVENANQMPQEFATVVKNIIKRK